MFADEQRLDPTLRKCFAHATDMNYHRIKNGQSQFYAKDGILFRYFTSPIRAIKQ